MPLFAAASANLNHSKQMNDLESQSISAGATQRKWLI
jgi:hypothetical protein